MFGQAALGRKSLGGGGSLTIPEVVSHTNPDNNIVTTTIINNNNNNSNNDRTKAGLRE